MIASHLQERGILHHHFSGAPLASRMIWVLHQARGCWQEDYAVSAMEAVYVRSSAESHTYLDLQVVQDDGQKQAKFFQSPC